MSDQYSQEPELDPFDVTDEPIQDLDGASAAVSEEASSELELEPEPEPESGSEFESEGDSQSEPHSETEPETDLADDPEPPPGGAPETGDLVIDAALRDLAEAPADDLDAQIERGEQVQRTLQGRLSDLGG